MVQKFSKLKIVVQQINFTAIQDLTPSQRADMMMMSLQNQPKIAQVQFLVKIEPEAKLSFSWITSHPSVLGLYQISHEKGS